MSEKPSCQNCAAFNAFSNECRRHAPTPIAVPDPMKPGHLQVHGMFPGVSKTHWCLDFLPDAQVNVQFVAPAQIV